MDKVDIRSTPGKPKAAPANLPKNAHERTVALSGLMERLADHLDAEAAAVTARRPAAELAELARAKQPMILVCEELSRLLRVDRDGMAALPAEAKAGLAEATRRLTIATAENAATLQRMAGAQQILVNTLVDATNRYRRTQPGVAYQQAAPRPNGPITVFATPKHGPGTAATLNTRL